MKPKTPRIAILASGEGTTAEAFIRAAQAGNISCEVELVICNRRNAGIFGRIADLNAEFGLDIPCELINSATNPAAPDETVRRGRQTEAEETAILDVLLARQIRPDSPDGIYETYRAAHSAHFWLAVRV